MCNWYDTRFTVSFARRMLDEMARSSRCKTTTKRQSVLMPPVVHGEIAKRAPRAPYPSPGQIYSAPADCFDHQDAITDADLQARAVRVQETRQS